MPKRDPFLSLAENSPDFIGICDHQMVPFFVNAAGRRLVGLDADQDLSQLLVTDFFFAEDREWMTTEFFDRVVREGKAETEVRFRHFKTGEAVWMLYNVFPVTSRDGEGVGFATVSRNITSEIEVRDALRAGDHRLREVLNLVPQLICLISSDGHPEYVNDRWSDFSGLDLEASADAERLAEIVHPDDRPVLEQRWSEARTIGAPAEMEVRLRSRDGTWRWFLSRVVPLREGDQVMRWLAVSTDIHAQKEASRALQEIDRRKDEFLATLSHELRTPLTSGYGWVKLLAHSSEDRELRAAGLAAIEQSFVSQIRLIDDLLDVSRIIAGKLQLEIRPTDLASAVERAIATVRPAAKQRNVQLETHVDPGTMVEGDGDRLTQIVWNLLSNAIRFTPPGGVVEVVLRNARSRAEIIVRDTGQGIDPAFLPFVFDRFRQADSSVTRRHGGLGLGLSIVASLVAAHGGTVRAESEGAGQGATFTVTLPLMERVDDIVSPRYAETRVNDDRAIAEARVLVVDDDDASRVLMKTILERAGAEVRAVASVSDALDQVITWRPDLLLSDLSMPTDDGYSFIRQLRASGNDVPAIAVTAFLRTEDAARKAGFQDHLPKPFTPADLIDKVREAVRR